MAYIPPLIPLQDIFLNPWNSFESKSVQYVTSMDSTDPDDATSGPVDRQIHIWMDFNPNDGFKHPQLNNIHFTMPTAPPLTQRGDVDERQFCNITSFAKGGGRVRGAEGVRGINMWEVEERIVGEGGVQKRLMN